MDAGDNLVSRLREYVSPIESTNPITATESRDCGVEEGRSGVEEGRSGVEEGRSGVEEGTEGVAATVSVDDLRPFLAAVADARVIGLGEATHGTRDFFQLKHRLLQAMVLEQDLRLFGMEAHFAETMAIDDYIAHGDGDAESALRALQYEFLDNEAVLAMVEWLRAFNDGRPLDDRVRVYGLDAYNPAGSVPALVEYLEDVDPEYLTGIRDSLAVVERGFDLEDDAALTERLDRTQSVVEALPERLADRKERYVAATSPREWRLAHHHAWVLHRAAENARARLDHGLRGGFRARETSMTASVGWILDHEPHDRLAIWAHNLHIARTDFDPEPIDTPVDTMGRLLADDYGDDYYALGFEFAHGSFRAIPRDTTDAPAEAADGDDEPVEDEDRHYHEVSQAFTVDEPPEASLAAALQSLQLPLAFLDLQAAVEDADIAAWCRDRPTHATPGSFSPGMDRSRTFDLRTAFDGVIYVAETNAAVPRSPP